MYRPNCSEFMLAYGKQTRAAWGGAKIVLKIELSNDVPKCKMERKPIWPNVLTRVAVWLEPSPASKTTEPRTLMHGMVKVKVHTLDIAPLRSETPSQKRSGMIRVLKRFHSFTCTPTRSSAIGMSHTCLCLPSRNWYSFTDSWFYS